MKERGSGLKPTSNEFMETVFETPLGNDPPQCEACIKVEDC